MNNLLSNTRQVLAIVVVNVLVCIILVQYVFAATSGTLLPRGDGNFTQWTPSTGTTHNTLVDDSSCNGTTDYNSTTVVGNRDSYIVSTSSIPNGATITQIDIKPCASRNGTGNGTSVMNVFYRFANINSSDSGAYSFTSGNTPGEQATTTFSGLSLLQTGTTALEVGAIYSSGTKGLRLSRIAAFVTYTPLAAPSGLAGNSTTTSVIVINWTDNASNEEGFSVERSSNGNGWNGIATTSANASSYYDSGLTIATAYSYRIRAFNFGAYSAFSNTATATTTDNPPAAPSDLVVTAATSTRSISLGWTDNSSNESNFKVQRSLDGSLFSHLATTSANVVTYVNSGLATTTTYYYEVRAYNSGGYSSFSNVASSTTI